MDTSNLIKVLLNYKFTRVSFCGVYAIDQLPIKKVKRPCSFIINTDTSDNPGTHWYAIYLPKKGPILFFDSFGLKPYQKEIYNFISKNGNKYWFNKRKIQSDTSINCGKFCVIFIAFCSKNFSTKIFCNLFSKTSLIINDKIIEKLFNKLYSKLHFK